jgi:hypothetical protein
MEKINTHLQNVIKIVFIASLAIIIGDLIQFVQYLYNLNFQEAMNKIIEDFSLPFKATGYYDRNKILEIQRQRELEKQQKEKERLTFIKLCKRKNLYNRIADNLKKEVNHDNWEELTSEISFFENRANLLEIYICDKYNIEY